MRPLSAAELLTVRERGAGGSPAQRALLLLTAACDDLPPESVRQFCAGERDARLLDLHERVFGATVPCLAECPACRESVEWDLRSESLRLAGPETENGEHHLTFQEFEMSFRLPTAGDLAAIDGRADPAANRRQLLRACIHQARRDGEQISNAELPAEAVAALSQRMAELDPQADLQFNLHCPQCAHEWIEPFDIGAFFWTELQAAAGRLLREVHELASAYGWSETDILALSPQRRQAYLELVRA